MITTKVAGDLQAQLSSAAADEPLGVIVRHKPDILVARAMPDARVGYNYRLIPATALSVSPADIEALSHDETVDYIWPPARSHLPGRVGTAYPGPLGVGYGFPG